MSAIRETAFAKINLALHVCGRRRDGYHDIETIFAFCEDGDTLTVEPSGGFNLSIGGPFGPALDCSAPTSIEQAADKLCFASSKPLNASLRLDKQLPIAAGLGGGSADAAAALRALNRLWGLDWPLDRLEPLAREIGADVPACLHSVPMRGSARGDQLESIDLGLSGTPVLLVNPRVELSTPQVFAAWDGIDRGPLDDWRMGRNDLQEAATRLVPQLHSVGAWLSAQDGVELVRMSGSGATCFAFFDSDQQRNRAAEGVPRDWWRLATRLR